MQQVLWQVKLLYGKLASNFGMLGNKTAPAS